MNKANTPNSFVAKIDLNLAEKMKGDLIDQGFTITVPPYTLFSGKKKGISCTLYASGKLVVQGKEKNDFITFYLEPEILKELSFSYPETLIDTTPRIGIDEAGKGDFYGPLCIAGVYAGEGGVDQLLKLGVRDSKRMKDQKILSLAAQIRTKFPHSIVKLFPKKYNELYEKFRNLNHLLAWGHATAIGELVEGTGCRNVIIDQFASEHVVENALKRKELDVSLTQRHYGEEDPVVAAASILARAAFVEGIDTLSKMIEQELPKGASAKVTETGRILVAKHGPDVLEKVAKLHFKTTGVILNA
ncbi:MAG: Ribonuclease HIII [Chlamydiae bacterium]|nr:Ribonuclease HIII [Chlamydiota bacterium]